MFSYKNGCLAVFEQNDLAKVGQLFYKFESKDQQNLNVQRLMELGSNEDLQTLRMIKNKGKMYLVTFTD